MSKHHWHSRCQGGDNSRSGPRKGWQTERGLESRDEVWKVSLGWHGGRGLLTGSAIGGEGELRVWEGRLVRHGRLTGDLHQQGGDSLGSLWTLLVWLTLRPRDLGHQVLPAWWLCQEGVCSESPSPHLTITSGEEEGLSREAEVFGLDSALQGGEGWSCRAVPH